MGTTISASASDVSTTHDKQINELFDELSETVALSLLTENTVESQNYETKINQIDNELASLGVESLSDEELEDFFIQKGIPTTRVSQPSDTNTVKWYLYTVKNQSYGSTKYDIQRLFATGNNPGGMLVTGKDNEKFYSGLELLANGAKTAISIYVQKAIGSIPVIGLTPYELLFTNSPSAAFNSSYVTHRCVSNIEFTYVKKSSQSDDEYALSKFSNRLSIAIHTHGAAVVNGVPKTYSQERTTTTYSDHYGSIINAIQAYINNTRYYDYIPSYKITSYDNRYSKTVSVPNPLAGPGQIY